MVQRLMEIVPNLTLCGPLLSMALCDGIAIVHKRSGVTRSQTRTAATRDAAIRECLPWDFLAVISLIIHHTVWQIAIFGK